MRLLIILIGLVFLSCQPNSKNVIEPITPDYITDQVNYDSDDPAIWVNPQDPSQSIIYGTDKHEVDGGLYAFTLTGKRIDSIQAYPLDRPNNVDIAYQVPFNGVLIDVAVCTERGRGQLRVFKLPELTPLDSGGILVFEDDLTNNLVMGVALYKRPQDSALFAIISRKELNVTDDYLYQYVLQADSTGFKGSLSRKFGKFSGTKEIEAVAVDAELGYVYYSDEYYGIHKYYADPEMGNEELSVFGLGGFVDDREGISIYKKTDSTGYILVSNQGANSFMVFPREGTSDNPHRHELIMEIPVSAMSSDGSEVTSDSLGSEFPNGLFVAMSDNKTFEIFDWTKFEKVITQ
ncbi:MAG: phytase [Marinoscillum sp.]